MSTDAPSGLLRLRNTVVAHVIAPGPVGGAESVVRALVAEANRHGGHAVLFVLLQSAAPHPFVEQVRADGLPVTEIRCGRRRYRAEVRALTTALRAAAVRVVHTHGYHADLVGSAAARACGLPVVTTVHGFTGGGWKNRIYEWLQRRVHRRFDAVVAVAEPLARALVARGTPARLVRLVPSAYARPSPPLERADARAALGVGALDRRIGWVGRLCQEKGADVFLDALAMLKDVSFEVSIIGDGPERPALDRQAAALGLERVTWHGNIRDAGRLLRAFDGLVISSRTEGTPIVLFEAMDAGVPVISAAVGGIPDVIGANEAILVAPAQPAVLAEAIRELLRDPGAAAQRAGAALAHLHQAYTVDAWLQRYDAVYGSVLDTMRA